MQGLAVIDLVTAGKHRHSFGVIAFQIFSGNLIDTTTTLLNNGYGIYEIYFYRLTKTQYSSNIITVEKL